MRTSFLHCIEHDRAILLTVIDRSLLDKMHGLYAIFYACVRSGKSTRSKLMKYSIRIVGADVNVSTADCVRDRTSQLACIHKTGRIDNVLLYFIALFLCGFSGQSESFTALKIHVFDLFN